MIDFIQFRIEFIVFFGVASTDGFEIVMYV